MKVLDVFIRDREMTVYSRYLVCDVPQTFHNIECSCKWIKSSFHALINENSNDCRTTSGQIFAVIKKPLAVVDFFPILVCPIMLYFLVINMCAPCVDLEGM